MNSMISRDVISDRLIRRFTLKEKLRLRIINRLFKDGVESWLKRFHLTLHLRGPEDLSIDQTIIMIRLSPDRLDTLIMDQEWSEKMWIDLKPKLIRAQEIRFKLFYYYRIWRHCLPFEELECKSIVFEDVSLTSSTRDLRLFQDLLTSMRKCPSLVSIYLSGNLELEQVQQILSYPSSFVKKIKQIGFLNPSKYALRAARLKLPDLLAASLMIDYKAAHLSKDGGANEVMKELTAFNSILNLKLCGNFYLNFHHLFQISTDAWSNLR